MKSKILIIVFVITSILSIGYIFYNSFQESEESNARSEAVVEEVKKDVKAFDNVEDTVLNVIVRKMAHVIEFTCLGLSLGILIRLLYKDTLACITTPLLLALMVAISDEFIQSLNDRTSAVKDCIIDFSGATIGVLIAILAWYLIKKKLKNYRINFKVC